jgi:hypothetical protein
LKKVISEVQRQPALELTRVDWRPSSLTAIAKISTQKQIDSTEAAIPTVATIRLIGATIKLLF